MIGLCIHIFSLTFDEFVKYHELEFIRDLKLKEMTCPSVS